MTKRKVENIEALLGITGAQVIADVDGAKVNLLSVRLGANEHADILHMLLPFMRRRIEEHLRDYTTVGPEFDWEPPHAG